MQRGPPVRDRAGVRRARPDTQDEGDKIRQSLVRIEVCIDEVRKGDIQRPVGTEVVHALGERGIASVAPTTANQPRQKPLIQRMRLLSLDDTQESFWQKLAVFVIYMKF